MYTGFESINFSLNFNNFALDIIILEQTQQHKFLIKNYCRLLIILEY